MTGPGSPSRRPSPGPWREIADRVFVRRYAFIDQTIGLVVGDGAALVVDSRSSPRQAAELRAEVRSLTAAPLVVVNTHHHWDHTFGNAFFRPAPIWGHERCAAALRERGEAMRRQIAAELPELMAELAEVAIDPPDRTFTRTAALEVGDRAVELRHLGRGHTDNDIVVLVPDAAVLFAGDLVEVGAPPSFSDAYPLDWPGTLGLLLDLVGGPVVPGHGEVSDRTHVEGQLGDIAAVASAARRTHADGGGPEDAAALVDRFPEPVTRLALTRAFAQLRGEL